MFVRLEGITMKDRAILKFRATQGTRVYGLFISKRTILLLKVRPNLGTWAEGSGKLDNPDFQAE